MTTAHLLSKLDRVRQTGPGRWLAACPAHDDRRASLSIRELENGRVLVHDFAGCDVDAVVGAIGLTVSDLFPPRDSVKYERQSRHSIHPADALAALAHEALIVLVTARSVASGDALNQSDLDRLSLAVSRISAATGVCNGH